MHQQTRKHGLVQKIYELASSTKTIKLRLGSVLQYDIEMVNILKNLDRYIKQTLKSVA